ncbi:MAG TPA: pyridoxamine 5'-phosphate oxidase family protein [Dongiaceae bacterium]|nr:pyridoxamine 5'-phosphate oxidase family protein [Dongiaceae bacterium]
MNAFTPTARSRAKRLHERASYDEAAVFAALDAAFIAHIGYVIDGQPYVTPTAYWRTGRQLYWHGSSASRMLRSQTGGVPVCVTVTQLDGLVLARSGFHHSLNYRSVMAFGTAHIVDDATEKARELDRFIDRLYPGRRATLRPNEAQELKATTLIGMEIEEAAVKVRSGGPKDDDADYALDCWAGVIPIRQVIGTPESDPLRRKDVAYPAGLGDYQAGATFDAVMLKVAKTIEA